MLLNWLKVLNYVLIIKTCEYVFFQARSFKNEVKKHLAKYISDFTEFKPLGKWKCTVNSSNNGDENE